MQTQMEDLGYDNVFIGTVEGEPEETSCESVIDAVEKAGYKKVVLRPLMVVAGDHANNDMAGDDDDSWLSMFKASGKFDSVDTCLLYTSGIRLLHGRLHCIDDCAWTKDQNPSLRYGWRNHTLSTAMDCHALHCPEGLSYDDDRKGRRCRNFGKSIRDR